MTDTKTLYAAMAKAFASMEGANKDTVNPHFKVRYADLASVVSAIKPALTENDLWFRQYTHEQSGGVCVETMVCHASGEELSFGKLFVPASKQDAQGYGSALTYARRYSLMTAFGICPEDDDGNSAKPAPKQSDGPALISDEQRTELIGITESFGFNPVKVCSHYSIKDYRDIPADEFNNVKTYLEQAYDNKRIAAKQGKE
jgi:ERF superfamily